MMIDLGEYICGITINKIIDNFGTIKQLSLPLGDTFGSMNINNDIIDIIVQLEEYLQILEDIEKIKKKFVGNESVNFEIYAKFKRNITLSYFKRACKYIISIKNKVPFFEKISKDYFVYHNYTIKFDNYKVYIPG